MDDMEYSFAPEAKKYRLSEVNLRKCWICEQRFENRKDIGHPDLSKLDVLFTSIKSANDNEKLLLKLDIQERYILDGKISLTYHHNCRSKYMLKRQDMLLSTSAVTLRPKRSMFNFKELCFVCGKTYDRRHRRDKRRGWSLVTNTENIFDKVYTAAVEKEDDNMILRLSGIECKDMMAKGCRYHRGNKMCLSNYLSMRKSNATLQHPEVSKHQTDTSFSRQAHALSTDEGSTTEEMCSISEEDIESLTDLGYQSFSGLQFQSKQQTMYEVVSFLRADIEDMTLKAENYPDPSDLEINNSKQYVPDSLLQIVLWLVDKNAFENLLSFNTASQEARLKTMNLCETIMCMTGNTITPQSLGTAVYLDHKFGSSELINVMSGLGYCVTYDELRRYKTSAALHTLDSSKTVILNDIPTYVPTSLKKPDESKGTGYIHEGTDNIDINVETKDGKGTFHALARFMFQDQQVAAVPEKSVIPRLKDKSLKLTDEILSLVDRENYQLPSSRPVPPRYEDPVAHINNAKVHNQATNGTKDMAWLMLRMEPRGIIPSPPVTRCRPSDEPLVPLWKGYNAIVAKSEPKNLETRTKRVHLPIIDAQPNDKRTLYTSMAHCQRLSRYLGQRTSMQTMDQQLYALAQEIKWHKSDEFDTHVLRLGSFHAMMSYISTLGKIWGDAGLRDLLVDSGVYAANTTDLFLQGKEYNRGVTAFIYAYEALSQVRFQGFLRWLQQRNTTLPDELWKHLTATRDILMTGNVPQSAITELQNIIEEYVLPLFTDFRADVSAMSPTFKFWDCFIDGVHNLLLNLRAEREGDWPLHLHSIISVLPYYAIADKVNYMRWTPVYLMDMLSLPDDTISALKRGEFSVRETCGAFIGTASDMGTEHKIKELKGPGGLKHISRKQSAMIRYTLTRHITGSWVAQMKNRAHPAEVTEVQNHKEQGKTAMARDEENVRKIAQQLTCHMHNPFEIGPHTPEVLINISTGMHATSAIEHSLLSCVEKGKAKVETFIGRSLSVGGKGKFHDAIKQTKLKTFKDLKKTVKVKTKHGIKETKMNPELIFRRAIATSGYRSDLNLQAVLSIPTGGAPLSLFHDDGSMRKPTKTDLAHFLEDGIALSTSWPQCNPNVSVYIVDFMVLLHKTHVQHYCKSFGEMADALLETILQKFKHTCTVICVFDQYGDKADVKAYERKRRVTATPKKYDVIGKAPLPNWKHFLEVDDNKSAFSLFISNHFETCAPVRMKSGHRLFLTGGFIDKTSTKLTTCLGTIEKPEMRTGQLESDSRMFFMANHMNTEFAEMGIMGNIIIYSTDTDVLVLASYHSLYLANSTLYWETGTTTKYENTHRFVPVQQIVEHRGSNLMSILPHIHALSGCDSTSAFFYIGKKTVMKTVFNHGIESFMSLSALGESNINAAVDAARIFVSTLYDTTGKYEPLHGDLNRLRTKLASTKDMAMCRLPPCEPVFYQHVLRVMWQVRQWVNARNPELISGSPFEYGWKITEDEIEPIMFEGITAAEMIDGLACVCKGKKARCKNECPCFVSGLSCIELCTCEGDELNCHNPKSLLGDHDE